MDLAAAPLQAFSCLQVNMALRSCLSTASLERPQKQSGLTQNSSVSLPLAVPEYLDEVVAIEWLLEGSDWKVELD